MENALLIGLSQQMALRRRMDVTANNIANMDTPGFKAERMLFVEYLSEPEGAPRAAPLSMVSDQAVVRDRRPGPLAATSGPLDLALDGEGYLVVDTPAGPRYTRNGRLALDPERRLVDGNGLPVLDAGGGAITLPDGAAGITVSGDGTVSTSAGVAGRLRIVRFEDPFGLVPVGGNLLASNEAPADDDATRIAQGMVERSNVEPIVEMTQMIEILRQYQSAQKLIDDEHDRQLGAIQKLSQMPAAG